MLFAKNILPKILILTLAATLITCGGGGGGGVPDPEPELKEGSIIGIATLGPISDATVTSYDFSSGSKGTVIKAAAKPTDANGLYKILLKSKTKPILVCIEGGSYYEAASPAVSKVNIAFSVNDELCTVTNFQTGQAQTVSITYYTNLAYGLALNKIKNNTPVTEAVTQANKEITDWLGLDIVKTLPADITSSSSATERFDSPIKYGFANAGLSLLMKVNSNNFGNANSKQLAQQAFDDVKVDGLLNGRGATGDLNIGAQKLEKILYRDTLARNILDMGNNTENATNIKSTDPKLSAFADAIKLYSKSVFSVAPPSNKPPVAVDDSVRVNVGSSVIIDVLANDTDSNGDALKITPAQDLTLIVKLGTVTINAADNTITYVPNANTPAGSTDTFSYFANDGYVNSTLPATVTVSIVDGTNTAPIANDDSVTVSNGTTKLLTVLTNDIDADGNSLSARIITQPTKTANQAVLANGGINFIAGAIGLDTFTYLANDGLVDSNIATVTVNVTTGVNSAPVAVDDAGYSVQIGQSITIYPLDNDPDADGDALTAIVANNPRLGNLQPSADKISFIYTPASIPGLDTFTYFAFDGIVQSANTATVSIDVTEIPNTAPTANSDTGNATIGGLDTSISVLDNDFDNETATTSLRISSFTQPTNGGTTRQSGRSIIYTPPRTGTVSSDTFTYVASDGSLDSLTATVTVYLAPKPNTPPVANDDSAQAQIGGPSIFIDVLANDTDAETPNSLVISDFSLTQPNAGSVSISGTQIRYMPPSFSSVTNTSFTYQIFDKVNGSPSNTATVRIKLSAIANIKPTANNDSYNIDPNKPGTVTLDVLINDTDSDQSPNGGVLTVVPGSLTTIPATIGSLTIGQNNKNILFTSTSNKFKGDLIFSYRANDGTDDSNTATVTLTIANTPPIGVPDTATARIHGPSITIQVLANDSDPNGDILTLNSVSPTIPGGSAIVSGSSIIFTPDIQSTLSVTTISYSMYDDSLGGFGESYVTITLLPAFPNNLPVANPDFATTRVNVPVTIMAFANDTDADGDTLYSISYSGGGGIGAGKTYTMSQGVSPGEFIFTSTYAGKFLMRYDLTDLIDDVSGVITITVNP